MALDTYVVKKGDGTDETLRKLADGRSAAASSAGVALSTEDKAALDALLATGGTITTSIIRPADTNIYTLNDALADSTSAPTTGGFTFTGAGRASGGSGYISDLFVVSSADPATTLLQGEVWIFDGAVTAINDNAAFALSDADAKTLVAVIPFTLATTTGGTGTNSFAHIQGLNIGYTCVASANLRFLVKVKNAYTPISAEELTFRLKVARST